MGSKNLKDETLEAIRNSGHSREDVLQVQDGLHTCGIDRFLELADREYEGRLRESLKVRALLVVLFNDGTWLERSWDDATEWWSYRYAIIPQEPDDKLEAVFYSYWKKQ